MYSRGTMISTESSRAVFEVRRAHTTFLQEYLSNCANVIKFDQDAMNRINEAFETLKAAYYSASPISARGGNSTQTSRPQRICFHLGQVAKWWDPQGVLAGLQLVERTGSMLWSHCTFQHLPQCEVTAMRKNYERNWIAQFCRKVTIPEARVKGSQEKARREDLELVSIITLSERKRWVQQGRDNSMEFDKSLWRSFMESLHVYTTPIGD